MIKALDNGRGHYETTEGVPSIGPYQVDDLAHYEHVIVWAESDNEAVEIAQKTLPNAAWPMALDSTDVA